MEVLLRASSAVSSPAFHFGNTVRLYWPCRSVEDVGTGCQHALAGQRFCVLRGFAPWAIQCHPVGFRVRRETAQNAKGWPSSRASLTRSRSCSICDRQLNAHAPLAICQKRNAADARPRAKSTRKNKLDGERGSGIPSACWKRAPWAKFPSPRQTQERCFLRWRIRNCRF